MKNGKNRINFDDIWPLLSLVLFIGLIVFIFMTSVHVSKQSSSEHSNSPSCEEEWDTHGNHHRICDQETDGDTDSEPDGYDEWLERQRDDYEYEKKYEEFKDAEDEYYERLYGD